MSEPVSKSEQDRIFNKFIKREGTAKNSVNYRTAPCMNRQLHIVKLIRQLLQYIKWEEPFAFLEFGGPEFNATEWWSKASSFADILSPLAVRLFTIKPHAAGPERVFSLFDSSII